MEVPRQHRIRRFQRKGTGIRARHTPSQRVAIRVATGVLAQRVCLVLVAIRRRRTGYHRRAVTHLGRGRLRHRRAGTVGIGRPHLKRVGRAVGQVLHRLARGRTPIRPSLRPSAAGLLVAVFVVRQRSAVGARGRTPTQHHLRVPGHGGKPRRTTRRAVVRTDGRRQRTRGRTGAKRVGIVGLDAELLPHASARDGQRPCPRRLSRLDLLLRLPGDPSSGGRRAHIARRPIHRLLHPIVVR